MRVRDKFNVCLILCSVMLNCSAFTVSAQENPSKFPLENIKLPPGFKIEIYAQNIPNARSMALSPSGTLFVGTRTSGNVYAIQDVDHDNRADRVIVIAHGLRAPNGVAFRDGALYVALVSEILRFDDIENNLEKPKRPVIINNQFPEDGQHGWKFIRFGPDGLLYVPVGAPCNACERSDPRYMSILRLKPDGSEFVTGQRSRLQLFASGIRNTVGFDWDPETNELWFTDNGRDDIGDDLPPDELNHAPTQGMNFGFPYCHGKTISDPSFGQKYPCEKFTPATLELGAHVAALGMRFYTGDMFPSEYKNQIFIAEHGSWARTVPTGYRIMLVRLKDHKPVDYTVFAEGWLQAGGPWGRPVDLLVMPDGSLLVSDDHGSAIYRITYQPPVSE